LRLHQSGWIAEAEDLQNETLVFLIRQIDRGDEEPFGRLLQELRPMRPNPKAKPDDISRSRSPVNAD